MNFRDILGIFSKNKNQAFDNDEFQKYYDKYINVFSSMTLEELIEEQKNLNVTNLSWQEKIAKHRALQNVISNPEQKQR